MLFETLNKYSHLEIIAKVLENGKAGEVENKSLIPQGSNGTTSFFNLEHCTRCRQRAGSYLLLISRPIEILMAQKKICIYGPK